MKVLIYAFEPFGPYKLNLGKEVLLNLRDRDGLGKVLFPVQFDEKMFVDKIKANKPSVVLGVGQYPRGKKFRIESKAVNLKRISKKAEPQVIKVHGPESIRVTLRLETDANSWRSYNAGEYVCNFSMYIILKKLMGSTVKFGFVHIPKVRRVSEAVRFLESKLDEIML